MSQPRIFKIVLLGDTGVGKTALIHQFVEKEFRADFKATIGADFSTHNLEIDGQKIEMQIWDTAGQERFNSVGSAFYRGTDACILVFDCTQLETFKRLDFWKENLFSKSGIKGEKFPIIIFSNKSDLSEQKQVTYESAKAWAESLQYDLIEVSAKTGENVEAGFRKIVSTYLEISAPSIWRPKIVDVRHANKSSCC